MRELEISTATPPGHKHGSGSSAPSRLWRYCLTTIITLCALFVSLNAHAAFTITRTSGTVFYTDSSITPRLVCNYLSFQVTSTTAVADAWADIGTFTGIYLSVGGGDDGKYHFGSFAAGETKPAFFYICSSLTTTGTAAGEGYTVKIWNRDPALAGATQLGSAAFTGTIDDGVIQANPNTVQVIFSGPNPAQLGGIITLTIEGDTGTIGCVNPPSTCSGAQGGPLVFTPAAYSNWKADAYELIATNILLTGNSANAGSYDNQLYIDSVPSSGTTHYLGTYLFRAVTSTSTSTTLSPIANIASGTQIKHTLRPMVPMAD